MAGWDDVRRLALTLPETSEGSSYGQPAWKVRGKTFVWERPLRKADRRALGDAAPFGPILGARVEHLVAKEAMLADESAAFFTTPHFDGHPVILVQLERIQAEDLEEVVVEAWLATAPPRLVEGYLAS